jgi:prevent-host-death family protein
MKQEIIKASEFKAKCLRLMDEVRDTGKEIIISKNGIPVSKLVPIKKKPKTLFGSHKGQVTTEGDIVSPLDVEWDAMR